MAELNNRPELPEIFPQTDVTVEAEEHTFKVSETDSGTETKYEYTLDKAPVEDINAIRGTDRNGTFRTFNKGTDYVLSDKTERIFSDFEYDGTRQQYLLKYTINDNTDSVTDSDGTTYVNGTDYRIIKDAGHYGDTIEWLEDGDSPNNTQTFTVAYDVTFPTAVIQWQTGGDNLPGANTKFYVTYHAESVISRYLDASEERLDQVDDALQEIINNKFVEQASGDSLDELGTLFGSTIGKRRGRTDTQYRIYLKSVVQSFISRGTVNGIKLAISAATDVPIEDITINEDFTNVKYEVEVIPNNPVAIDLLEEVAEIADPSGVDQELTRLTLDPEEMLVDDNFDITEGNNITEVILADDTIVVDGNKEERFETMAVDDANQRTVSNVGWGTANWGSSDWTVEHN